MTKKYFRAFILIVFLLVVNEINAQPPPPGVPIDGGISGLFLVAIGFAIKKITDQSKK